jgi:hypothetical protein
MPVFSFYVDGEHRQPSVTGRRLLHPTRKKNLPVATATARQERAHFQLHFHANLMEIDEVIKLLKEL